MLNLAKKIKQKPVIFVTRDIERALGFKQDLSGYHIISNSNSFGKSVAKNRDNILLIDGEETLSTRKLLKHKRAKKYIDKISGDIVIFKNTKQIQSECEKNRWNLLNPSYKVIEKVEQKISQVEWLGDLEKFLPQHEIKKCKEIEFDNEKFILQFNRSHTGEGTFLIDSKQKLGKIINKYPERPARITEYIKGQVFTLNCVIGKNDIFCSTPSYQITGLKPFTKNKFATIGNDWGLAKKLLKVEDIRKIKNIAKEIGQKLKKDDFRGLFGIDVIKSKDQIYLIEINSRQPASTTFESHLQNGTNTTFRSHVSALLDIDQKKDITKVENGAQIIYRHQENKDVNPKQAKLKLEKLDVKVLVSDNRQNNSELLRIMTSDSLLKDHNKLNQKGKQIAKLLK